MTDYINTRYNNISNRQGRYSSNKNRGYTNAIVISAFMILVMLLFVRAIDKNIQNQDLMLCQSAKISGNTEYLEKCECYYNGSDINCLQNNK